LSRSYCSAWGVLVSSTRRLTGEPPSRARTWSSYVGRPSAQ